MMGPKQVAQGSLFYEFSIEDHVPSDHLLRKIDRYLNLSEIRADIKELQDVEKVLKAGIGERLGTATVGTFDGRPVVKYAHSTTARLDTARLRFEQPELSAEYTKISRSRTLRVLK